MVFSSDPAAVLRQADTLRLLSYLFDSPSPALAEPLAELAELYEGDAEAQALLCEMAAAIGGEEALVALKVEHAKLFVGPFDMLAPPYASLYLEAGDRVDGQVTRRIARCYVESGLRQEGDQTQPADHVAFLFEFLYYLLYRSVRDEDSAMAGRAEQFACTYVLSWTPQFFEAIHKGAKTPFYSALAKLGLDHFPPTL